MANIKQRNGRAGLDEAQEMMQTLKSAPEVVTPESVAPESVAPDAKEVKVAPDAKEVKVAPATLCNDQSTTAVDPIAVGKELFKLDVDSIQFKISVDTINGLLNGSMSKQGRFGVISASVDLIEELVIKAKEIHRVLDKKKDIMNNIMVAGSSKAFVYSVANETITEETTNGLLSQLGAATHRVNAQKLELEDDAVLHLMTEDIDVVTSLSYVQGENTIVLLDARVVITKLAAAFAGISAYDFTKKYMVGAFMDENNILTMLITKHKR